MLVLEKLLDKIERLAASDFQELTADCTARKECLTLSLAERLGEALLHQDLCGHLFRAAVHSRKACASFFEKRAMFAAVSSTSRLNTRAVPSAWAWPNS